MIDLTYAHAFDRDRITNLWNEKLERKDKLTNCYCEGAYILPKRGAGLGGVADADLNEIALGRLYYGDAKIFGQLYEFDRANCARISGEVVYLGPFRNQWGHFLIDNVPRLHEFMEFPKALYAFSVTKGFDESQLLPQIARFFELLGISRQQLVFITQPVRVEKCVIEAPSYWLYKYYSDEYLQIFRHVARKIRNSASMVAPKRILFSKSGGINSLNYLGWELLDRLFKSHGYTIFHPERLSLDEQICFLRNCEEYAFSGGTGAHNTLFTIDRPIRAVVLTRHHMLERALFESLKMANAKPVVCDFYLSPFPINWTTAPVVYVNNANMKKYISDHSLDLNNDPLFSERYQVELILNYVKLYVKTISHVNFDNFTNQPSSNVAFIHQGHLFDCLKIIQAAVKEKQI